jgi:hypothetical protein
VMRSRRIWMNSFISSAPSLAKEKIVFMPCCPSIPP